MIVEGRILWGINNIYSVKCGNKTLECRIKGKVLKNAANEYNPLSAGDMVKVETEGSDSGKGLIFERLERKTSYFRWNKKRNAPQIIAANFDLLVVVASVENPPFRPRFVDRVLVMADTAAETLIVVNKADNEMPVDLLARLKNYRELGYDCLTTSAKEGIGIDLLKNRIEGKTSVFFGQSGVGKSSLLNVLFPGIELKVGGISVKYKRGRHTTNFAQLIYSGETGIVDTPGVREIEIFGIDPGELQFRFPEMVPLIGKCRYPSCLHMEEPRCSVKEAVETGSIHRDRYESYMRILKGILENGQKNYTAS